MSQQQEWEKLRDDIVAKFQSVKSEEEMSHMLDALVIAITMSDALFPNEGSTIHDMQFTGSTEDN